MEIPEQLTVDRSYPDKTIYETEDGLWQFEVYDDGEIMISCNAEFTDTLVISKEELFDKLEAQDNGD